MINLDIGKEITSAEAKAALSTARRSGAMRGNPSKAGGFAVKPGHPAQIRCKKRKTPKIFDFQAHDRF